MYPDRSTPRVLQQQQPSDHDVRQQQSGLTDFQQKPGAQPGSQSQSQSQSQPGAGGGRQQMGEGSYEATRDYQKNIKGYLDKADVERDAQDARPRSEAEAKDLEDAEREGKSHSRGER